MLRYRLIDPRGNDLGPYVSRTTDWHAGARISLGAGEEFVVLSVVEPQAENFRAYLVVERVSGKEDNRSDGTWETPAYAGADHQEVA